MAPRRKKKLSANPARGYLAEYSNPPKPKPKDTATAAPGATAADADTATTTTTTTDTTAATSSITTPVNGKAEQGNVKSTEGEKSTPAQTQTRGNGPALDELSPEELEAHLRDAELHSIIDQYGAKCLNDSSRQISKFETEKRLLRGQAMNLNIVDWLPPALLDEVINLEKAEVQRLMDQSLPAGDEDSTSSLETEACVKLWILRETLLGLGFKEDSVEDVLPKVFYLTPRDAASTSRETVWGLESAIKWLALYSSPEDLPSYRTASVKPSQPQVDEIPEGKKSLTLFHLYIMMVQQANNLIFSSR